MSSATSVRERALKARALAGTTVVWRQRLPYKVLKDGVIYFDSIRNSITPSDDPPREVSNSLADFAELTLDNVLTTPIYQVDGGWCGDVLTVSPTGDFSLMGTPEDKPHPTQEEAQELVKGILSVIGSKVLREDEDGVGFKMKINNRRFSLRYIPDADFNGMQQYVFSLWPDMGTMPAALLEANLGAMCLELEDRINPAGAEDFELPDREPDQTLKHYVFLQTFCAHYLGRHGWRNICRTTVNTAIFAAGFDPADQKEEP